jgi:elongation factor 1-gamma
MATYKLHTYPGNFRAFKILVAAQYNGVDVEVPEFDMATNKSAEFLAKNPLGKVPVLETEKGCIFESNAIARFIARIRRDTELYGSSFFESAQIDSWLDFCTHEIELPATMWFYPVFGYMPFNAAATAKAKEDLKKALAVLEKHLLHRTYIVGDQVTLADIVLASALVYPMKLLMDKGFRKGFTCVTRWFTTCVNQPAFKAVVGDVPLCAKMLTAAGDDGKSAGGGGGGKKAKKEKAPQKKKEKAPKPAPAPKPKKVEHPLSIWMKEKKPKMHPDEWKKTYKNAVHTPGGYRGAADKFWEIIDRENYSLWICRYNHNEDNSQLWMTSNAIGGFCDRTEAIRKWTMGVQTVSGEEGKGNIFISGLWCFLGDSAEHMLECNPDAEYYTWTEIPKDKWDDPDTRKMVSDFWCCALETDTLEGRPYYDSKVFV